MTNDRRPVSMGDRSPDLSESGIERFEVEQSTDAALGTTLNAVRDILANAPEGELEEVSKWIEAILKGSSIDERVALERELANPNGLTFTELPEGDDVALSPDWRSGGYPYRNLMSRKAYEREKYKLQVELLKMQAWVNTAFSKSGGLGL